MISHKYQYIFIHIPKTGGNSLSLFLKDDVADTVKQRKSPLGKGQGITVICSKTKNPRAKHYSLEKYHQLYPSSTYKKYFKFAIKRNPYDWLMSCYWWQYPNDKVFVKDKFKTYVKSGKVKPQTFFISKNGIVGTDFLVRFENLIEDLKGINVLKGHDFRSYPHLNKSSNSRKGNNYDEELRDLVYLHYEKDFKLLGYEKE